jgi:hypothetical protein
MRGQLLRLPMAAVALILTSCSGGNSGSSAPPPPPPAAKTLISGAVVDAEVINATVTAYEVSSTGVVGVAGVVGPGGCVPATPGPCATATTDAQGNYTVDLGSYSGPVLMQSTGGTYTDTVTGQTVPIPNGVILSSFVPAAAPGSTTITAQISGLTTMAANLALANMGPPLNLGASTAATNADSVVGSFFGVASAELTSFVDLTNPNCATAGANQANFDASLILAGIEQVAAQFGVNAVDLTNALVVDFSSNSGVFTGFLAGGASITVGNTQITLQQIEGNSLGMTLLASIQTFVASTKNACKGTLSATATAALTAQNIASTTSCAAAYWCYTANAMYTGPTGISLSMFIALSCPNDQLASTAHALTSGNTVPSGGSPGTVSNVPLTFIFTASQFNSYYNGGGGPTPYNYNGVCGTNSAIFSQGKGGTPANCTFTPTKAFFLPDDSGGTHNTSPIPVIINCTAIVQTFTVGGPVSGLPTGTTLAIADTINGDSTTVSANGSYSLAAQLGIGAPYNITATPSNSAVTCAVSNGSGSIGSGNANVPINCSGGGGGGIPPVALSNPNGLLWQTPYLFVANSGGANGGQVLVYSEQLNSSTQNVVSGLTLVASITQGINVPSRLAVDANNQLYVANAGNNTVTVYNINAANVAANTIAQITADTISSGIARPLGIAVDSAGMVYVANNSQNSISIFQPASGGGFSQVGSALTSDGESNAFLAPGALFFDARDDVLLVGLGPSSGPNEVLTYTPPLTSSSRPLFALSNSNCSTGPSGPTGFAYYPLGQAQVFISNYYNSSVQVYGIIDLIGRGSGGACPAPEFSSLNGISPLSQIAQPEGVAVDGFGNVFVANSSANTVTAYLPGTGISASPVYTQH